MRKIQPCGYCHDTGWVCENHFWIEAHTCECGGAGMPCRCNTANPPWEYKQKELKEAE